MKILCMRVNRTCWQVEKIRKVMQVICHMLNNGYQVFAVGWIQPDGTSIFSGPQHCHSHHIVIPTTSSFPQQRHSRERESRKGNLFSQVVYSWQQRWTRELTRQWRLRLKVNRTRRTLAMSAGFSFRCPVFRRIHTGIGTQDLQITHLPPGFLALDLGIHNILELFMTLDYKKADSAQEEACSAGFGRTMRYRVVWGKQRAGQGGLPTRRWNTLQTREPSKGSQ